MLQQAVEQRLLEIANHVTPFHIRRQQIIVVAHEIFLLGYGACFGQRLTFGVSPIGSEEGGKPHGLSVSFGVRF